MDTLPELFLSIGDPNFHDLLGGRDLGINGIRIPFRDGHQSSSERAGTGGASIVIGGHAGSGKTTLACQLCAYSLRENNARAAEFKGLPNRREWWPLHGQALFYTLDQRPTEIADLLSRLHLRGHENIVPRTDCAILKGHKHLQTSTFVPYEEIVPHAPEKPPLIYIRHLPYGVPLANLLRFLERDIDAIHRSQQQHYGDAANECGIKLVVVDAINAIAASESAQKEYLTQFRHLLGIYKKNVLDDEAGEELADTDYSVIVTYELGDATNLLEAYLPQCVIILDREVSDVARRLIEIRKARHQPHFVGRHDMRIESQMGIRIFPSVATRARQIPEGAKPDSRDIKFGLSEIDDVLDSSGIKFREGSATLLWGDPGTGKTELASRFLAQQLKESPATSVLLVTTKISPITFENRLVDQVKKMLFEDPEGSEPVEGIFERYKSSSIKELVDDRFCSVDAADPYRPHALNFTDVVDAIYERETSVPFRRAVVFGLGLLEESFATRDDQWRYVSVLVRYLAAKNISTLLVDWPLERVGSDRARSSDLSVYRPRASKLCANELNVSWDRRGRSSDDGQDTRYIKIYRGSYQAINHAPIPWPVAH